MGLGLEGVCDREDCIDARVNVPLLYTVDGRKAYFGPCGDLFLGIPQVLPDRTHLLTEGLYLF